MAGTFTKTQAKVLETFASKIEEKFSIRQISGLLGKPYPLIHRTIKFLLNGGFLTKDSHKLLSLNYRENHSELAYIESLRKHQLLKRNKTFALFVKDALSHIKQDFFILLLFGSYVENPGKAGDIDVLVIAEDFKKINLIEKLLNNLASNFSIKLHINAIGLDSAYEMLAKREEKNLMNETLNKHVLIFGAENYYRILKNARK
jgi:predicted nucleotidyltransferase